MFTIVLSFILGAILEIAKFNGKGLAAKISAIYIDVARNLPLMLVIIGFRFMLPLPTIASGVAALTFLNCALIAEIIRGGMNAIPKG